MIGIRHVFGVAFLAIGTFGLFIVAMFGVSPHIASFESSGQCVNYTALYIRDPHVYSESAVTITVDGKLWATVPSSETYGYVRAPRLKRGVRRVCVQSREENLHTGIMYSSDELHSPRLAKAGGAIALFAFSISFFLLWRRRENEPPMDYDDFLEQHYGG